MLFCFFLYAVTQADYDQFNFWCYLFIAALVVCAVLEVFFVAKLIEPAIERILNYHESKSESEKNERCNKAA